MRSALIIELDVHRERPVQLPLAQNQQVVQAFLPEQLAVEVWRRQPPTTLGLAAPPEETAVLAGQLRVALASAARPAPALDRLFRRVGI